MTVLIVSVLVANGLLARTPEPTDPIAVMQRAETAIHDTPAIHYYGRYARTVIEPSASKNETYTVAGAVWLEQRPGDELIGWKIATISSTAFSPEPFMIRATYDGDRVSIALPTSSRVSTYEPTPAHLSIVTDFQRGWILQPYIMLQKSGGNAPHPIMDLAFEGTTASLQPNETVDGVLCRVIEIVSSTPNTDDPVKTSSTRTTLKLGPDGLPRDIEKSWVFGGTQTIEHWTHRGVVTAEDLADELFEPWVGPGWKHEHTSAEGVPQQLSPPPPEPPQAAEPQRPDSPRAVGIGDQAPDIVFTMPDGTTTSMRTLGQGPILLDFWGTWCGPCIAALPEMKRVHERFAPQGLTVLGVSCNEPESANPQAFLRHRGIAYDTAIRGEDAARTLGVRGYPTLILLSKEGVVLGRWIGYSGEQAEEITHAIGQAIR